MNRYVKQGWSAVEITADLVTLRHDILISAGRPDAEEVAEQWGRPLAVDAVTWDHVATVNGLIYQLQQITEDRRTHPGLLDHLEPLTRALHALRSELAAATASSRDNLIRQCVVDLMGEYRVTSTRGTPLAGASDPPQYDHTLGPALCTYRNPTYRSTSTGGYEDLVVTAWRTYSQVLADTGDTEQAHTAAMSAAPIDDLEPAFITQLRKTALTVPPDGTAWDQLVAQWRLDARTDLAEVLNEWTHTYQERARQFAEQGPVIAVLEDISLDRLTGPGPLTRILAQVPVQADLRRDVVLAVVPGVVGQWLRSFTPTGLAAGDTAYRRPAAKVLVPATDTDDVDTLRVALSLWEPQAAGPLSNMTTAIRTAQGVAT